MSSGGHGTAFVETEALLAVLDDDEDGLLGILGSMTDAERQALARAADRLGQAIRYGILRDPR